MATPSQKKPYLGQRGWWLTFWITVACCTDMLMFGYDQAIFSGVIITQDFLDLHNLAGPEHTTALSTLTAIYDVGCFFGAIIAFTIGERLGRKKTILIGTLVMSVGTIIMAASYSLPQMFVGRIVLGVGNGINTATAPIWQTETAKPHSRGKLVMLEMLMNIAGFMVCQWINYGLSFAGGDVAWRFPIAFQFVFIFTLFATVPWLPESPRWLISHSQQEEASIVLASLEAKNTDDASILAQMQEIQYSVDYEKEHAISWLQLLRPSKDAATSKSTRPLRRLLLGAGTQFIQQFEGINIMSYYLPTVLQTYVGVSNEMSRLLSAVNSVSYFIFTIFSVPLVERWGRRGLMLLSTAGQGLCFLIITILLRFASGENGSKDAATASVAFFFLYYISFGIGMLGVPWLYPTEINSLPMRTKGAAVATATNWITNFVIVEITPIGINSLGWKFWIVWTVFNAAFLPVIYLFYPETANRTLEDIDEYYRNDASLIVIRDKEAISSKRPLKFVQREDLEIRRVVERRESLGEAYASKLDDKEAIHVENSPIR